MNTDDDGAGLHADGQVIYEVRQVADAHQSALLRRRLDTATAAEGGLREAIHAAVYDQDVSWQSIGDALGLARGNAYQRFRRRN